MVSLDALKITENLKLGLLQPYWPARHRHRKRLRFQQTPRHTRRIIAAYSAQPVRSAIQPIKRALILLHAKQRIRNASAIGELQRQ
jgi:hypothetical protein